MQGTIWLANYGWRYEAGITLVGVVGFTDNGALQIAAPGFDFAFSPKCELTDKRRIEAEIKAEIRRRFPQLFQKKTVKRVKR